MTDQRPVLVLEHEWDSPIGLLDDWLEARGLAYDHRRIVDGLPDDPQAYGAIVSLGSVQSANDPDPWVAAELDLLQRAAAAEVPLLGLCFGAQLLAKALGGTVARAPAEEFGWIRPQGPPSPITAATWFCWHGDAFTLPPDATLLASSPICPQAFELGRAVGFQFHPECDEATTGLWLEQRAQPHRPPLDLTPTAAQFPEHLPGLERRAFGLFDWWWERVGAGR